MTILEMGGWRVKRKHDYITQPKQKSGPQGKTSI